VHGWSLISRRQATHGHSGRIQTNVLPPAYHQARVVWEPSHSASEALRKARSASPCKGNTVRKTCYKTMVIGAGSIPPA
jgi:hypothetical protein